MAYEIEFLPVGNGDCSGDAIVLRYTDADGQWRVMVIDAGYEETGERVCQHIRRWYGTEHVDFVVSSHPDNDHMSGLRVVLKEMSVGELWMHIPRVHAQEIAGLFASRRWSLEGLTEALTQAYPYVEELVDLAVAQGTAIYLPFAGSQIGAFTVLSPGRSMYLGLLPQFRDTPAPDRQLLQQFGHWISAVGKRVAQAIRYVVRENYATETLREGGITSAENESCVVLYGKLDGRGVLFTADAGLNALTAAADFAEERGIVIREGLRFFQVPHHGSRNNVSPSILDRLVGPWVPEGQSRPVSCYISAGEDDETHPRRVVVNALVRRGLHPTVTKGSIKRAYHGLPQREGWVTASSLDFQPTVESYD
ncbi:MAG: ComEC/Rec2 family competence protein [Rhodospirillaceae bacterium]